MAKARDDRYQQMTDLLRDLEAAYEPLRGADRRVISRRRGGAAAAAATEVASARLHREPRRADDRGHARARIVAPDRRGRSCRQPRRRCPLTPVPADAGARRRRRASPAAAPRAHAAVANVTRSALPLSLAAVVALARRSDASRAAAERARAASAFGDDDCAGAARAGDRRRRPHGAAAGARPPAMRRPPISARPRSPTRPRPNGRRARSSSRVTPQSPRERDACRSRVAIARRWTRQSGALGRQRPGAGAAAVTRRRSKQEASRARTPMRRQRYAAAAARMEAAADAVPKRGEQPPRAKPDARAAARARRGRARRQAVPLPGRRRRAPGDDDRAAGCAPGASRPHAGSRAAASEPVTLPPQTQPRARPAPTSCSATSSALEQRDIAALKAVWPALEPAAAGGRSKPSSPTRESISVEFVDPEDRRGRATATVTGRAALLSAHARRPAVAQRHHHHAGAAPGGQRLADRIGSPSQAR